VRSGVPQGSVLGPCLFLFYINDIPDLLTSKVRLFADDTLVYLTIRSEEDQAELQRDLDKLAQWEDKWSMEFHPQKCQVMHVTRKRRPKEHSYSLHGHVLEAVTQAKYLGVTLSSDMRWKTHITNITTKANRSLGFLRRNLRINSTELKSTAYFSLVRPLVEYSSTVWDPFTKADIKQIEQVQRRAARYVLNRPHHTSSVGTMLEQLDWPTLEERRRRSRLNMMYKIQNDLVGIDKSNYLQTSSRPSRRTANSQSYLIPQSSTDYHLHSFFPKTVRDWNALPSDVVSAPILEAFKAHLN
jgi:hypothetical protein